MTTTTTPTFREQVETSRLVITRGARAEFNARDIGRALYRHVTQDWRDMDPEDQEANARDAARPGTGRVLGAFRVNAGPDADPDLWIITEADRSATTILLPSEY